MRRRRGSPMRYAADGSQARAHRRRYQMTATRPGTSRCSSKCTEAWSWSEGRAAIRFCMGARGRCSIPSCSAAAAIACASPSW